MSNVRFSLRTLLLSSFVLFFCLALALNEIERHAAGLRLIERSGGVTTFEEHSSFLEWCSVAVFGDMRLIAIQEVQLSRNHLTHEARRGLAMLSSVPELSILNARITDE